MSHMYEWYPIEEADAEDGTHTLYAAKMKDGRLVIAERGLDGTWYVAVECAPGYGFFTSPKATCKTLTSAKRWVSRYL